MAPVTSVIDPLVVLPLEPINLPIALPLASALMEEEIVPLVTQAPSLLDRGNGSPKEALIEIENVTIPLDEAFCGGSNRIMEEGFRRNYQGY